MLRLERFGSIFYRFGDPSWALVGFHVLRHFVFVLALCQCWLVVGARALAAGGSVLAFLAVHQVLACAQTALMTCPELPQALVCVQYVRPALLGDNGTKCRAERMFHQHAHTMCGRRVERMPCLGLLQHVYPTSPVQNNPHHYDVKFVANHDFSNCTPNRGRDLNHDQHRSTNESAFAFSMMPVRAIAWRSRFGLEMIVSGDVQ